MGEEKPDRRRRRKRGRRRMRRRTRRRQRARKGCEKDTQNAKIFMRNFLIRKIQAEKPRSCEILISLSAGAASLYID